jgi:hypothetical protein
MAQPKHGKIVALVAAPTGQKISQIPSSPISSDDDPKLFRIVLSTADSVNSLTGSLKKSGQSVAVRCDNQSGLSADVLYDNLNASIENGEWDLEIERPLDDSTKEIIKSSSGQKVTVDNQNISSLITSSAKKSDISGKTFSIKGAVSDSREDLSQGYIVTFLKAGVPNGKLVGSVQSHNLATNNIVMNCSAMDLEAGDCTMWSIHLVGPKPSQREIFSAPGVTFEILST